MDAAENALWRIWQIGRSSSSQRALLQHYLPWSRRLARDIFIRVRINGTEWADYVQNASMGLFEAIERYDPSRGIDFKAYARRRIRGSVFNGLRPYFDTALYGALKDSRTRICTERAASLVAELHDDPLLDLIDATAGLVLGFLLDAESVPAQAKDTSTAYAEAERKQLREALNTLVDDLPERDRLVITLHYGHQLLFVDIAKRLGVTKGRISQIHKHALVMMRDALRSQSISLDDL